MRILITGANGFTGKKMASLAGDLSKPILTDRSTPINGIGCDLTDFQETFVLLKKTRPQKIYHLAGSFTNDYETDYQINVVATKNILDSVLRLKFKCRILLVGSSAEYGLVKKGDNPVKETHPLRPVSIYGLTKTYQWQLMDFYYRVHGMDVVMARTFNLLGRGLSERLFAGSLYKQIDSYKAGRIKYISVGNTSHKRDYIGIDEALFYYRLIMDKGESGQVYNVGTGRSIRISALLKRILKEEGISLTAVKSTIPKTLKQEVADIYACVKNLHSLKRQQPRRQNAKY